MNINEFVQDNSGGLSSMRLVFLVWTLGLFFIWAGISIRTGVLQPLPDSVIILSLGVSGTKAVQRFGEKSVDTTPTS